MSARLGPFAWPGAARLPLFAGLLLAALLLLPAASARAQQALPLPGGAQAVGYWAGSLDTGQDDALSPAPSDRRRLGIETWFPIADPRSGTPKAWAGAAMGQALAGSFPFPAGFEGDISAHAREGVGPAGHRLPVVLFSHGLSFPPTLYQSFFEDLASRGYVVIAVSHPHGAALIRYPDGTSLAMEHWRRIEDEEQRQTFLAQHAGVWTEDLRAVLDWVSEGAPRSPLAGRLDPARIAAVGHSYGGTAVGRLSADPRIKAVVAMEGLVRDPAAADGRGSLRVGAPLLHLIGGYNRLEHEGRQYLPSEAAPVYQAVVNGTGHAYFSDLIYLYRHYADDGWRERHRYEVEPARVLQISRDYIAAFLARYLDGAEAHVLLQPKSLADRLASPARGGYPEVDLSIDVQR